MAIKNIKEAEKTAKQLGRELKDIGAIGQIKVKYGVTVSYVNPWDALKVLSDTDKDATAKAEKIWPDEKKRTFSALAIIPDPNTMIAGKISPQMVDVTNPGGKNHYDFIMAILEGSKVEIEIDKFFWAHVQWVRLPVQYGGDLSVSDSFAENVLLITPLASKADALSLAERMRVDEITKDDVAAMSGMTRGFKEAFNAQKAADSNDKATLTVLTGLTKETFSEVAQFADPQTIKHFKESLTKSGGDIDKVAGENYCTPGDLALLLGDKAYFEKLGPLTSDTVEGIAESTGTNVPDLVKLFDIKEKAF